MGSIELSTDYELVSSSQLNCPTHTHALTQSGCQTTGRATLHVFATNQHDESLMATAGHSDSGAHGNSTFRRANSGEDREFDAEVARFLETELFATANGNSSGVMSFQPTADKSGTISVNEDLVFMDFIESIEMSDPELERVNEPSEDVHMSDDTVSSSSRHPAITATITTSENLQPTSSLQVVIPVSALATAAPAKKLTVHRQRRSVKKTGPPRPKVKKERKRVKDEIEHLRQQVTALEEKLDKLQLGSVEEEEVSDLPLPGLCEGQRTDTESQTTTTWESIAKRQELEKQKSKVVNLQLRKMVKNQLWLAKGLSSLLHSQQDIAVSTQARQLCVYSI